MWTLLLHRSNRTKRLTNTVLTGQEYRAVVELAPSQKVPPLAQAMVSAILKGDGKVKQPKIRVDARQGQIDTGGSDGSAVFGAMWGWRLTGGRVKFRQRLSILCGESGTAVGEAET
jgi:hypothetical protein